MTQPPSKVARPFEVVRSGGENLGFRKTLGGHWRTLSPFLARIFHPLLRPETRPWTYELEDPDVGPVALTGRFYQGGENEAIVCLHGLGGSTESGYMALMLRAAAEAGLSCLLLNCRGADRSGADIYHSGLSADLASALRCPELAPMKKVHLFGYSIGGHIALCYGTGEVDPRITKIAAVGSPLHLAAAADDFDAPRFNIYRSHIMDALKEIYTAAYQRRPHGIEPLSARKIQKIRDWDEAVIAPRFGFESANHYYETQSIGPRLDELRVDALYIGATCDPMVKASAVRPYLDVPRLKAIWDDQAGHLGFSPDFQMGQPGTVGLEAQVISWFRS
jgi:predicted alpha/beta-fold hydrolase